MYEVVTTILPSSSPSSGRTTPNGKQGTLRIFSVWIDLAPMIISQYWVGDTRNRISRKTRVLFLWYHVREIAPCGMCKSPFIPVPPISSSLVNFVKLDAGKPRTVSTKSRETMLPCILPVSMVHFAIFAVWCRLVASWFARTWIGRIHGEGQVEGPNYIVTSAMFRVQRISELCRSVKHCFTKVK